MTDLPRFGIIVSDDAPCFQIAAMDDGIEHTADLEQIFRQARLDLDDEEIRALAAFLGRMAKFLEGSVPPLQAP